MDHFQMFQIIVIFAFAFNSVECSSEASDSNIKINLKNVTSLSPDNPEVETTYPLVKEYITDDPTSLSKLTYYAGQRVDGKCSFHLKVIELQFKRYGIQQVIDLWQQYQKATHGIRQVIEDSS